MKKCSKCRQELPLEEFNRKKEGKQPWCKRCNRERSRKYYADNREKHITVIRERAQRVKRDNQQKLCKYLSEHPCIDCGEDNILSLEFDHVGTKSKAICHMMTEGNSWESIEREIAQCEVVCANCHRIRTARRDGRFYRWRYLHGG